MNVCKLNCISREVRPKVLLIGNGLNRSFSSGSWNDLLGNISTRCYDGYQQEEINNLPFPLQAVVLTEDNVDEGVREISKCLCEDIPSDDYSMLINKLLDNDFDAILTTNYSYDIEKSLDKEFSCKIGRACKYRKCIPVNDKPADRFGLHKFMRVADKDIWHIHGEAGSPNSMVLGHYYYGKILAQIQEYIPKFMRTYNGCAKHKKEYYPKSWIDYFILGDVYIIGLGLDPSEFDLWWLLNCKKRRSKEINVGKVFWYEPNLNTTRGFAKKILAESNDIEIITKKVGKTQYRKYYEELIESVCIDLLC